MNTHLIQSPIGQIKLAAEGEHLVQIKFVEKEETASDSEAPSLLLREAEKQLQAYFNRQLTAFDLPLAPLGTEFQMKVWHELLKLPYGATWTYKQLALRLKSEKLTRAVGLANGKNPLAIVVPCHRVVGANGALTGYAGGLHRKQFLLGLESPQVQQVLF
ncbi:methylated-DNA--[protein]-cysteine S-methyltransferase [bacterium]|nr:methylated-DNA--[protein]-cysteine S-methyltransferase [bacterium]